MDTKQQFAEIKNIMIKSLLVLLISVIAFTCLSAPHAEARARYGSTRIGGYTSDGKGSHYVGGYVRTGHTLKYYSTHYR